MRPGVLLLSCIFLGGCATFHGRMTAVKTTVVVVEGSAPIVNGDIAGAKKASLDDAMKNALGLVTGVYVSQESIVSKVRLVEDTILTQTKGYIQRYSILRESQENGFYKTTVKAEVCRENRSAKPAGTAPNPGPPPVTVAISVEETVDGAPYSLCSVQNALKNKFAEEKFIVSESTDADIVITGKAAASRVPDAAAFGFVSYRTVLSLAAAWRGSGEIIAVEQGAEGGVDITREAAANASLVNAARRAARDLMAGINKAAQDHAIIRLTICNVSSLDSLNTILHSLRALPGVKDCRVSAFSGYDAHFDLEAGESTAFDIARRIEKLSSGRIIINQVKPDGIQAICLYNEF